VLIDVSAGQAIAEALRELGHDVLAVRDHNPRMKDTDILAWATAEMRLVVTMDKDFGELVFRLGQAHAGVLLLRLESATSDEKVHVVRMIFNNLADQLPGKFAVYQDGRVRIR
jgi:predicted nuclease of predicted toxin-antitoxin system